MIHQRRQVHAVIAGIVIICTSPAIAQDTSQREVDSGAVALDYYRTLAEGGSADAQLVLGDHYRTGDGVEVDPVEAYAWYYLAVQQGLEEGVGPMNEIFRSLSSERQHAATRRAEMYSEQFIQ